MTLPSTKRLSQKNFFEELILKQSVCKEQSLKLQLLSFIKYLLLRHSRSDRKNYI